MIDYFILETVVSKHLENCKLKQNIVHRRKFEIIHNP